MGFVLPLFSHFIARIDAGLYKKEQGALGLAEFSFKRLTHFLILINLGAKYFFKKFGAQEYVL